MAGLHHQSVAEMETTSLGALRPSAQILCVACVILVAAAGGQPSCLLLWAVVYALAARGWQRRHWPKWAFAMLGLTPALVLDGMRWLGWAPSGPWTSIRGAASVASVVALLAALGTAGLLKGLRELHVPNGLRQALSIMLLQVERLARRAQELRLAARSRGFVATGWVGQVRFVGQQGAAVLAHAVAETTQVASAMKARGYPVPETLGTDQRGMDWRGIDWLAVAFTAMWCGLAWRIR